MNIHEMSERFSMKKTWSIFKKCLIAVLVCCFVMVENSGQGYAITYADITSDAIKDKENKIDEAKEQKEILQKNLSDLEALKKELEKSKKNLQGYVSQLDSQLEQIEAKIEELNLLIGEKEAEIADIELELAQAIETEKTQYEAMKLRIQFMYEQGNSNYLSMLFEAENFSDMLNKADYIEQISAYDRDKLDEYAATTAFVRVCKEELEVQKSLLDEAKAGVLVEQENVEGLIAEKTAQIVAFQSDISNKEAAIQEYEEDLAMQNEIISALEAQVIEEKKEILAENGIVLTYDGGKMTWPCPSYTRISSEYGYRIHPTLGVNKFHNGVDMAAPKGTKILAACSGEVVAASYNSSMGNYVMMNHGNGVYTVYMHASKLCVSVGDIVLEGEKIAEVGSTGRSTGPHLHFSVRKNGQYVNPMDYL